MATKVGEGYLEIKPRLTGFNRELIRDARRRIRELEEATKEATASLTVKPKIVGITKIWQREVQQELNSKITGLTVNVKVKLDQGFKATFEDFSIEAKQSGKRAGDSLSEGFKSFIGGLQQDINKANIAIKTGFKDAGDPAILQSVNDLGDGFKDLAEDIDGYSRDQVRSINSATNSFKTLNNMIDRETSKATREYEKSVRDIIRATDRMSESVKNTQKVDSVGVFNLAHELMLEIQDANRIADALFPDLDQRVRAHAAKTGLGFAASFGRAFRANFFDNVTESILSFAAQLLTTAYSAQAVITAFSNLSAGAVILGSIAVDLYGSFAALPAVWAAAAQASGVLTAAFWGVQEALTALQNQEQHAAANAAVQARQIASAQEQIADAKERLNRAIESANENIARAEEALGDAMANAARRISDAQERVGEAAEAAAEAVERANERVADAQKALSRAYVTAAERVQSAEDRHADAIKRVRDAQLDLNQAYSDALERFEDLNIALGNAVLDEEGARIAIERAKERLDETLADPNATDLDKREADLAYREAIARLEEIQERNEDLRKEVEEGNKTGVEGSKEVTDARQRIIDAQLAEIEAAKDVAKAHQDASQLIQDAQERVMEAQSGVVEAQLDGAKRIQEAEEAVAEARIQAAEDVARAQENVARAQKDNARSIVDSQKDVARAIDNLTEVQERQNEQFFNAQYAMSLLSPEAQKFVRYLNDHFIPRMREVQFSIQDAFFPPIQRALSQSGELIDLFQVKLTDTATIFGGLIGQTIEWLNTPETLNTLGSILDSNNKLFILLGEAGRNFGDVLLVLAEAAGPFLNEMGKLVLEFSAWLRDVVTSKEGREELRQFFANVGEVVRDVYDILMLVGPSLYEIYQLARPYAQELLDDIADIAKEFSDWVNSTEGQQEIEKFLENGQEFLQQILFLIEEVGKAFFDLGKDGNLSGLIQSIRVDLLPAILGVIDAFGGGNSGGGFIFLIKVISVGLNTLAGTISLVAALINGITAIFTGDWSGAADSFADFLDSVRSNAITVFGSALPDSFAQSSQSFNDSVRHMADDQTGLTTGFNELNDKTAYWATGTSEATGRVSLNYSTMSNEVATSTSRYRDDVDIKTKEATTKAETNSKATRDAVNSQMRQMQIENEKKMEEYRKTVDQKTKDAKDDSNRNIGQIVKDAATLLVPFSSTFEYAAREAQKAMSDPERSWWSVGAAIIDGLWQGVKDLIPNLLTSIWNLGVDIVNWIRKALDSSSPSKKMISVGKDVGEGLVIGVESMTSRVSNASKKLGEAVTDAFGSPVLEVGVNDPGRKVTPTVGASGMAGVGPRSINYVTVNAAPTVPTEKQISNVLKQQEALYN